LKEAVPGGIKHCGTASLPLVWDLQGCQQLMPERRKAQREFHTSFNFLSGFSGKLEVNQKAHGFELECRARHRWGLN
jgi:hypothetical protein